MSEGFGEWLKYLVLPEISYGSTQAAYFARLMRSSMLEVMNQDFITTAVAKGQRPFWVIVKHALRNALLPIVTGVGMVYTMMLGGAFVTESLFRLPVPYPVPLRKAHLLRAGACSQRNLSGTLLRLPLA